MDAEFNADYYFAVKIGLCSLIASPSYRRLELESMAKRHDYTYLSRYPANVLLKKLKKELKELLHGSRLSSYKRETAQNGHRTEYYLTGTLIAPARAQITRKTSKSQS